MTEAALATIKVIVRHSAKCPKKRKGQDYRDCNCRKSLYIYENGKVSYLSCKTRSWTTAELVAKAERDRRDPVKQEQKRIAAEQQKKLKPLKDALDEWIDGMKTQGESTMRIYRQQADKILRWAARPNVQITYVSDVTAPLLNAWRSTWKKDAIEKDDRLGQNAQAGLLRRVKSFFKWATAMGYAEKDPALILQSIPEEESKTQPLTPEQYIELLAACDRMTADGKEYGRHLRALFQFQRWTGTRVGDPVCTKRTAFVGNRIKVVIRKKRNRSPNNCTQEFVLPDEVVDTLNALPGDDPYWWPCNASSEESRVTHWILKVSEVNDYVTFTDEHGNPMEFRSHMLRDTFAVEMLLADMPLEEVARLLGHSSVKTTERYYAKWTKRRKQKLEEKAIAAMKRMGATFTSGGKVAEIVPATEMQENAA